MPAMLVIFAASLAATSAFQATPPHGLMRRQSGSQAFAASATSLRVSLKPAALPLMDSGKAIARSGELLVDLTTEMEIYGGGLSAVGAALRNCGDAVAQAAASCRFKTGLELVSDELREGGDCLIEAVDKLKLAKQEAEADNDEDLQSTIDGMLNCTKRSGEALEATGAAIMQRYPLKEIGGQLIECSEQLLVASKQIEKLVVDSETCKLAAQRMVYGSEQMQLAATELLGTTPKPSGGGKSWLKG